jgi:hypothetical protein
MVLNGRGSSVDGAVHIRGQDGALRVRFPAATGGAPGDSARVLGVTVGPSGARRFLGDGLLRVEASQVRPIRPVEVSLADASDARGGALDADLVIVREGVVTDTATVPFEGVEITVSAGVASLKVLLPEQNGFGFATVVPGTPVVSIAGLLLPDPSNLQRWQLVPRGQGDVQLGDPPDAG